MYTKCSVYNNMYTKCRVYALTIICIQSVECTH